MSKKVLALLGTILVLFTVILSCVSTKSSDQERIGLEIISGNNQSGLVGRCAEIDLVVRVYNLDRPKEPLEDEDVSFEITQGGGTLLDTSIYYGRTNGEGKAGIHYHYGDVPGINIVTASILGIPSVSVNFTLRGYLPKIETGPLNAAYQFDKDGVKRYRIYGSYDALGNVIRVKVIDPIKKVGVQGVDVRWEAQWEPSKSIVPDKSVFLPDFDLTDSNGEAVFAFVCPAWDVSISGTLRVDFPEFQDKNKQPLFEQIKVEVVPNKYLRVIEDSQAQIGLANNPMKYPLSVFIKRFDINNQYQSSKVIFEVIYGGGTIDGQNVVTKTTGTDGIASINYTFGPKTEPQIIKATDMISGEYVYFAMGVPKVNLVRKSVPEDNTPEPYVEDEQIWAVDIYDENGNLVPSAHQPNETFMEYKTANQNPQPPTITLPLKSLNACGHQIAPGYAPSYQDIELQFVKSNTKFAIYRSGPIVMTTQTPSENETIDKTKLISVLPSGQRVMQGESLGTLFVTDKK